MISECVRQRELEKEHGRVLIMHEGLVVGYMKDILKGKVIFKLVPFLPLHFNCPVFTPDDNIMRGLKVKLNLVLKFFPQ